MRVNAALCVLLFCCAATAQAENWPRFLGPDGKSHSTEQKLPTTWDEKSLVWKTPLKGIGQSSPIVWDDRIYLTSAAGEGKQRFVFCVSATDGKVLWEQLAWTGTPDKSHKMNGWATSSCCTDGKQVYAWFGLGGLYCYTADGKLVWSRTDLGTFHTSFERGTAASLILVDDKLIVNGDSDSEHSIFAFDPKTGKTLWTSDRPQWEGNSTPIVWQNGTHKQLILNGERFVAGYDVETGKEIWQCKSFAGRGEPVPALGDGIIYVVNGLAGDFYAVKLGGEGDVTKSHMLWHTKRKNGRDGPSPLLVNDLVIVTSMKGICSTYEAATGKEIWKTRIGGDISSTPLYAGKVAYFLFEDGETLVMEPGKEFKEIARNHLPAGQNEIFRASPTPYKGHILIRSDRVLYCVGGK